MHIYIYIYIYIYTQSQTNTHTYIHTHIYKYKYIYIYIYLLRSRYCTNVQLFSKIIKNIHTCTHIYNTHMHKHVKTPCIILKLRSVAELKKVK